MNMQPTVTIAVLWFTITVAICGLTYAAPTDRTQDPRAADRIKELCCTLRETDQVVYNALDMTHKPSRDKELLHKNLQEYNNALLALRKMAVDHKDQVLQEAKDIFDEGLPKYFRVSFAEYKLKDNLDMTSDEVENIYVYRGQAMDTWSDLHFELGIPW